MPLSKPTADAAPEYSPLDERKPGSRFFSENYRVRTGDIDQEMRVRLDGLARYLQDIANDNIAPLELAQSDPFWIVRRTVIDVLEPITWPSDFVAERWCGALSTRWTDMRVRLRAESQTNRFNPEPRPNGLVETVAFWINVNEQGMPSRISDEGLAVLAETALEDRLRWKAMNPEAPAIDDVELPDREHILRITDFDPFKHLNNAAYLEAVEDELVEHPELLEVPHRMVIEYLRPITPGTPIMLRRKRIRAAKGESPATDCLYVWMMIPGDDGELVTAASISVFPIPATA